MNKTNKFIIIVALILIIVFGVILLNRMNKSDNNSENVSAVKTTETTNKVATKKSNGTFEIYNTDIRTNTGSTVLTATIKNVSGSKIEKQMIEIVLLDKNNKEIGTMKTTIPSLEAGTTTEITAEDLQVYENIYDFKIK